MCTAEEEYLGDVGLMEYPEEREQEHLPLEEHNLQESGTISMYVAHSPQGLLLRAC